MIWEHLLEAAERRITGPEDEVDLETGGDPDSTLGEEDEEGFDEMVWFAEWQAWADEGFEDAEGEDDEDDEEVDDGEE